MTLSLLGIPFEDDAVEAKPPRIPKLRVVTDDREWVFDMELDVNDFSIKSLEVVSKPTISSGGR